MLISKMRVVTIKSATHKPPNPPWNHFVEGGRRPLEGPTTNENIPGESISPDPSKRGRGPPSAPQTAPGVNNKDKNEPNGNTRTHNARTQKPVKARKQLNMKHLGRHNKTELKLINRSRRRISKRPLKPTGHSPFKKLCTHSSSGFAFDFFAPETTVPNGTTGSRGTEGEGETTGALTRPRETASSRFFGSFKKSAF